MLHLHSTPLHLRAFQLGRKKHRTRRVIKHLWFWRLQSTTASSVPGFYTSVEQKPRDRKKLARVHIFGCQVVLT
jgi:hypothetical protein